MKKILTIILLGILLIAITGIIISGSFDSNDNREIGYEFLDDGKVVHIWNTQDDYFFNKSSGIQFTNHFQDYWTRNIFCIGYYDGEEWIKIKCADELTNFEKSIESDDETYVNATLWKDIEYGNYDMRLGVRYHLGLNDENLSITIYGKNIGIDIPFDLGFAWKVTDWEIPEGMGGDSILINNSFYNLNETFDLLFKNMTRTYTEYIVNETSGELIENGTFTEPIPKLKGFDYNKFLEINWNENLNYAVKMHGNGSQEEFYVALLINAKKFTKGQEKSTTFQWIDATETDGTCTGAPTACGSQGSGTCATCGCSWDAAGPCEGSCSCSGITEGQCSACACDWDPANCYGTCSCSGITQTQCSACNCNWYSAGCEGSCSCSGLAAGLCATCGCIWDPEGPCAGSCYCTGASESDCTNCPECYWIGHCAGTCSCIGLGSSACGYCGGCTYDPAGPCGGSCSCAGKPEDYCAVCPNCYWVSASCGGSCSCAGKSSANCNTCPSCTWDPAGPCGGSCSCAGKSEGNCGTCPSCDWDAAGPCSGTPTVCANHATRTPCEACGCTWDSCYYSGSGDWNIDCADNCVITDNANLPANVINFYGTGTATLLSNITANKLIKVNTCKLITKTNDGNKLAIKLG